MHLLDMFELLLVNGSLEAKGRKQYFKAMIPIITVAPINLIF